MQRDFSKYVSSKSYVMSNSTVIYFLFCSISFLENLIFLIDKFLKSKFAMEIDKSDLGEVPFI